MTLRDQRRKPNIETEHSGNRKDKADGVLVQGIRTVQQVVLLMILIPLCNKTSLVDLVLIPDVLDGIHETFTDEVGPLRNLSSRDELGTSAILQSFLLIPRRFTTACFGVSIESTLRNARRAICTTLNGFGYAEMR